MNTKGDNSSVLKEDFDNKLLSGIVLNREYPLKKINNDTLSYFTPKISARTKSNRNKNIRNKDKRVDFINLFNTDRLNESTVLEGGEF